MVIEAIIYKLSYGPLNYVGSSKKTAQKRYEEHKKLTLNSSAQLFALAAKEGGTVTLTELEKLQVTEGETELIRKREQHHIEQTPNTVNKIAAYLSDEARERRRLELNAELRARYRNDAAYREEQKAKSIRQNIRRRRKRLRERKHKSVQRRLSGEVHCSYA